MARYEIWLCNDRGARISDLWGYTTLDRVGSFTATRKANGIGTFTADVPITLDPAILRRDMMIQVMRAPEGDALKLFRVYFLRRWTYETRRGKRSLELHGVCTNDLMRRRVVAAQPDIPASMKGPLSGYSDDILKDLVRDAIDNTIEPNWYSIDYGTRDWPLFSVEADASAGVALGDTLDLSYEYLYDASGGGALQQVRKRSKQDGVDLYWDVTPRVLTGGGMELIFRVRTDQPGADLTQYGVLASEERGNLKDASLTYDYTLEENYIYGVNEKGHYDTKVYQMYRAEDVDASAWNRCEGTNDRKAQSTASYLRDKRGKINFSGTIIDVAGTRYGVDWNFGDRMTVRYMNLQFNAIIKAVTLSVDRKGGETINSRLEYETDA